MDIVYLLKVLVRRKWTILFCLLLGITGGFLFRFFAPRQYVSTAQYSTGFSQTQKVSLQLSENVDLNQIDFRFNNVIETFKSPVVLGMVSYDLLLHDLESQHPFRTLTEKELKDTSYQHADLPRARHILHEKLSTLKLLTTYDPLEKRVWDLLNIYGYDEASLEKGLSVDRVPKTDYINVQFGSESAELSAYVTNTIGTKFKEFYLSLTTTTTKESLYKLDSLRESKRREVDELRTKLQKFRDVIGTPNPGDAATAAMTGLQDLTSAETQQEANLHSYQETLKSTIEQINALNGTVVAPVVTNNHSEEILLLRQQNIDLTSKMAQHGGSDPDIQRQIDNNINKMNQYKTQSSGILSTVGGAADRKQLLITKKLELESAIAASTQNIAMYKERVEEFRKKAYSGGGQEVVANAYENDLSIAQKDLEKYNSSIFASQDVDISPDFNFKQIILGQPAIKPEPLHAAAITAIAGLSMFFLACLFIIVLELVDSSPRTPVIFRKETKMPVLTSLGKINLDKKALADYFDFNVKSDREKNAMPFVENLRKLRFEIEQSGKKTILVTSTKAGEGKTLVIEALAHTFSMSKKKVLLVDANFSNNTLTRDFAAKPTLESFSMNGHDNKAERIWEITTITNITNIDIIGCEEGNYTPSEILTKNNLFTNFDKIIGHYDYVFIEGAAMNAHADSKELASYVDGIIAVFSAGNSLGETDIDAIRFFKETPDKFIGAVLNKVDEQNLES